MQLLAYGLIALAVMGMAGTGVYKVKQWGYGEAKAECIAEQVAARKREAELSAFAAKALLDERSKRKTIIQERTVYVDRNIEKLVDSGVCLTPLGVSCVNGSLDGKGSVGCQPDGTMPAAKPLG